MADAKISLDGDASNLKKELRSTQREVDRLKDKLAKVGRESKKTERASKNMGQTAMSQFKGMAAGLLGVQAIVQSLTSYFNALRQERQRAAQGVTGAGAAMGRLGQLARTEEEYQGLIASSKRISGIGGQTPEQAMNLQFALTSGQLTAETGLFARLRHITGPGRPREIAADIAGFQAAYAGGRAGSAAQILSGTLVASGQTKTTLSQLLGTAIFSAKSAQAVGTSPSELLSITALLTKATKSPEMAGTQVRALSTFLRKEGMTEGGIMSGVQTISTNKALRERMGSNVRAFEGYKGILDQLGQIQVLQARIAETGPELVSQRIGFTTGNEALRALQARDRAKAGEMWAEQEKLGPPEMRFQAYRARKREEWLVGESAFNRELFTQRLDFLHLIGLAPAPDIPAEAPIKAIKENTNELKTRNRNRPVVADPNALTE